MGQAPGVRFAGAQNHHSLGAITKAHTRSEVVEAGSEDLLVVFPVNLMALPTGGSHLPCISHMRKLRLKL